jgi:hypothetical protein
MYTGIGYTREVVSLIKRQEMWRRLIQGSTAVLMLMFVGVELLLWIIGI